MDIKKGEDVNKLSAGKEVDSMCTKCRLELGHLIVAMVGDKIAKVKCKTCGSVHNYREAKKTVSAVKKTTTSKMSKEIVKKAELSWEDRVSRAKGPEIPYEMGRAFKVGDVITHEIFGKGVVLQVLTKKCNAIFSDKERMLVTSN